MVGMRASILRTLAAVIVVGSVLSGASVAVADPGVGVFREPELESVNEDLALPDNQTVDDRCSALEDSAAPDTSVDGTATVFNPDPITTSGAIYGDPGFLDNNDATSAALNAELVDVTLNDITRVGTPGVDEAFCLHGPFVHVDAPEFASNDWNVNRSSDAFEAVNSYHKVDQLMRYYTNELGFAFQPLVYDQLRVEPNAYTSFGASYGGDTVTLKDGGIDAGESAAVIWHEVGHAFHDWLTGGNRSKVDGVNESVADYVAASMFRRLGTQTTIEFSQPLSVDHVRIETTVEPDAAILVGTGSTSVATPETGELQVDGTWTEVDLTGLGSAVNALGLEWTTRGDVTSVCTPTGNGNYNCLNPASYDVLPFPPGSQQPADVDPDHPRYNHLLRWRQWQHPRDDRVLNFHTIKSYPNDLFGYNQVHYDGQFLVGCMLDVHHAIGARKIDKALMQGLTMTDDKSNQDDVAMAVMQAAGDLGYTDEELHTMRGIFRGCGYRLVKLLEPTTPYLDPGATGTQSFVWAVSQDVDYRLEVGTIDDPSAFYSANIGSPGAANTVAATVTGLPTDGSTVVATITQVDPVDVLPTDFPFEAGGPDPAVVITVDGDRDTPVGTCLMKDAIAAANSSQTQGGCFVPAGSASKHKIIEVTPKWIFESAFPDYPTITTNLTVRGARFEPTLLKKYDEEHRHFETANGVTLEVANLILEGGYAELDGGSILARGPLTLKGTEFIRNKAGRDGGAVYAEDRLEISSSKLHYNSAVRNGGAVASMAELEVSHSHFGYNRGGVGLDGFEDVDLGGAGGAIYTEILADGVSNSESDETIYNSRFENNVGGTAGAIYAIHTGNCRNNNADNVVENTDQYSCALLDIANAAFVDNVSFDGGAVVSAVDVAAQIAQTSMHNNSVKTNDEIGAHLIHVTGPNGYGYGEMEQTFATIDAEENPGGILGWSIVIGQGSDAYFVNTDIRGNSGVSIYNGFFDSFGTTSIFQEPLEPIDFEIRRNTPLYQYPDPASVFTKRSELCVEDVGVETYSVLGQTYDSSQKCFAVTGGYTFTQPPQVTADWPACRTIVEQRVEYTACLFTQEPAAS